jgi:hypothetical protein
VVKKEGGVVRIEGGEVKMCKITVMKTLKTVVKMNCIMESEIRTKIWLQILHTSTGIPKRSRIFS